MGHLADEYRAIAGDDHAAAVMLARDLMRGDSATFKVGYSAPNAAYAAGELFGMSHEEIDRIGEEIEDAER